MFTQVPHRNHGAQTTLHKATIVCSGQHFASNHGVNTLLGPIDADHQSLALSAFEGFDEQRRRTDKSGFANLQIEYPREYANWATVRLRVTITAIAGTEVFSQRQITLPVLASDISAQTVAPPGRVSPFGTTANCASAN